MRSESHVLKMDTAPLEFSTNGEFALYSSHDGVLKLWETATNSLRNDYKPSSHLSASCSCLSWAPKPARDSSRIRKKRKSDINTNSAAATAITDLNLVAIGTASGNILLYSVVKGDLHSQLPNGHTDVVNGICWNVENDALYSCSSDHHVVEWRVTSAKIIHKWKADRGPVHSICRCSSSHLLTAGRSIKLWDLTTREVIKRFTGHATEVFRMLHIPSSTDDLASIENSYFLSAAANDRLVNAWQINTSSKDKNAVASFSLTEEPSSLQVSRPDSKDRPMVLVVVTKTGQALLFECTLNGKLNKPLQPKLRIQIATPGDKGEVPKPVPILAAYICDETDKNLILMHGNYLKPTFEKVSCNTSEPDLCLIREDPMKTAIHKDASVTKLKTPEVSKDVTVLAPGLMAPAAMSQDPSKRRKRKPSYGDMSIEERLSAISTPSADLPSSSGAAQPPKADTLARLLTQGLQSQDSQILSNVLQNRNNTLINNTVKKLPVQMIIPLIKELTKRMSGHAQSGGTQILWIKTVLTVHTSYLMTFPEIIETFSVLYRMMDSRVNMFGKLSRLQGKLDLMLSQIATQTQEEEKPVTQQPLLQYEEESSDEDLDDMAIGPGTSDSEENWEDFSEDSDMEVQEDTDSKG